MTTNIGRAPTQFVDPNTGQLTLQAKNYLYTVFQRIGGETGNTAPNDATYITNTISSDLTNNQALSLLNTGYVYVTTGSGVLTSVTTIPYTAITGLGTLATQSGTFAGSFTGTFSGTFDGTYSGTSSGTNTGDQLVFKTISVSGQSDVVADTSTDTLTLIAGTNVTITTDATNDTITINSTSGGSGTVNSGTAGQLAYYATSTTAVSTFNPPTVRAYDSGGTTCAASAYTKINLATESFDTNNNFTGSKFTPTVAGKYLITVVVEINSVNLIATNLYFAAIYKNGALVTVGSVGPALAAQSLFSSSASDLISMNGSTDYIELYFYNGNGATTLATATGATSTYFCANWVGA